MLSFENCDQLSNDATLCLLVIENFRPSGDTACRERVVTPIKPFYTRTPSKLVVHQTFETFL